MLADISSGPIWDSTSWDPWGYDENEDDIIQKMEAILAVIHYFDGKINQNAGNTGCDALP